MSNIFINKIQSNLYRDISATVFELGMAQIKICFLVLESKMQLDGSVGRFVSTSVYM